MLLTTDHLNDQFTENLAFSKKIYIASAWATCGQALDSLRKASKRNSIRIRAIIGTSGNATDPTALDILDEIGELKIIDGYYPMFHPKMYLFLGENKSCAWIGSANFTSAGFGRNEELIFETKDIEAVNAWFEHRWENCVELNENSNAEYRTRREREGIEKKLEKFVMRDAPIVDAPLAPTAKWRDFVKGLHAHNELCHFRPRIYWDILSETNSYLHTIANGRKIAHLEDWTNLTEEECDILRGLDREEGVWGLLGALQILTYNARALIPGRISEGARILEEVHVQVQRVLDANDDQIPDVAQECVHEIMGISGFGPAAATRFLTLARPDRLVSVNGASSDGLGELFRLPRTAKALANNYTILLNRIYEQRWFYDPQPANPLEQKISDSRTALLDAFVYRSMNDWFQPSNG